MNLGDISLMWPKVTWPDFSSLQGIIAFNISISAEKGLL